MLSARILINTLKDLLRILPTDIETFIRITVSNIVLNSGPFILKLVQQYTPGVDYDTLEKYGIEKLRYPKIAPQTADVVLKN